jgi:hypothetical protein
MMSNLEACWQVLMLTVYIPHLVQTPVLVLRCQQHLTEALQSPGGPSKSRQAAPEALGSCVQVLVWEGRPRRPRPFLLCSPLIALQHLSRARWGFR